jgi:hypothetical protein
MSAARLRSRALKAMSFIASTAGTMLAIFVTSMCLIVPSCRNFCFSAVRLAFMGVVLTVVSFWLMANLLRVFARDAFVKRKQPPRAATVCPVVRGTRHCGSGWL